MPWTSNLAEQALRHAKIHLKISGCFRSLETARAYCRIHSYLITIRLNAVPPMQAIRDALAGHPWTPNTTDLRCCGSREAVTWGFLPGCGMVHGVFCS